MQILYIQSLYNSNNDFAWQSNIKYIDDKQVFIQVICL